MIVDKNNPAHSYIPATLDGQVLLEETRDSAGNLTGFLVATIEMCAWWRSRPLTERRASGWDRHQAVLDALPANLPVPAVKPTPNRAP